jgi:hypothetical protein
MSRRRLFIAHVAALGLAVMTYALFHAPRAIDPKAAGYRPDGPAGFDRHRRLAAFPGKRPTDCPAQDARVAVVLAMGQSNIANETQGDARSAFPGRVFGFYEGRCMEAASPLLGASGVGGEWLTLLGDALIRSGRYDRVVLVPAAVGGQPIAQFSEGPLTGMLKETLLSVATRYRMTHALWLQGESDFAQATPPEDYRRAFGEMLAALRRNGVTAPVFVAVATFCDAMAPWRDGNAIQQAQRALVDPAAGVWPGPDLDALAPARARFDSCHLAREGQRAAAEGFFRAIESFDRGGADAPR